MYVFYDLIVNIFMFVNYILRESTELKQIFMIDRKHELSEIIK